MENECCVPLSVWSKRQNNYTCMYVCVPGCVNGWIKKTFVYTIVNVNSCSHPPHSNWTLVQNGLNDDNIRQTRNKWQKVAENIDLNYNIYQLVPCFSMLLSVSMAFSLTNIRHKRELFSPFDGLFVCFFYFQCLPSFPLCSEEFLRVWMCARGPMFVHAWIDSTVKCW